MSRRRNKGKTHWRKRQREDRYFQKAKEEGYRARSAYKLIQIDRKFNILRSGQTVLDLGAAPGSWSQVASKAVGEEGQVVAVDLQPIDPIPGATILQGDMTDPAVQERLIEAGEGRFDVILSDAAPNTTGIRLRDHAFSVALVRAALDVAERSLRAGGHFVAKVFEGEDFPELLVDLRKRFDLVKPFYPDATHREGYEIFVVCKGFEGE